MVPIASKNKVSQKTRTSALQKKVILLLLGGLALGLTRNPKHYFVVVREIQKEWENIHRHSLNRTIHSLYKSKLVATKDNHDGTLTLVLSKKGEQVALTYNIENMGLQTPTHWDSKWRMVMFDVPEGIKKVRDSLRMHFKNMGFYEFQKSVFIHPYPCSKEIEFLIEFYQARKYVRFIVATKVDNAIELKRHFHLI
ncbi:MAG: hypothetical protein WAV98_03050 [Minisyncoccia bacterium]